MNTTAITWLLPAPDWDDPKIQLLDDTWLLTVFAVLLATALPWFVSAFDIDFGAASLGVLVLGAIYVALTTVAWLKAANAVWRTRALAILHAAGVIAIGIIWQYSGGLQNPAFLLVFVLPVIGASFISRWQPYFTAALALVVVAAVALIQAPELRWYASGFSTAGAWLVTLFGEDGAAVGAPFPGFYAPSGYSVVLLEVFAILVFACAVAAEYFGTVFAGLHAHVAVARAEAERGQELWATLIEHLPLPAFLVEADTLRVVCASEEAAPAFCAPGTTPAGGNFFEMIRFSYPEVVQELITGEGGVARPSMIRVGDRLRAAEVRVQHIAHKGRLFALVLIDDMTEAFGVKAALDAADHAALVVDSKGYVVGFNKPALAVFPGTRIGAEASHLMSPSGSSGRWWEAGLTSRRRMHLDILQRIYRVTRSTIALPGEEESMYVIAFLPVAKAEAASLSATGSTRVQFPVVQLR